MITTPILTRNEQRILEEVLALASASDQVQFLISDIAQRTGLQVGEVIAGMVRLREYRVVYPEAWTAPRQATTYTIDRDHLREIRP